ncbi:FAD-dependent oxidoreductase [Helicobacter sp. MIT 14-3879]|uniref:FAD-dependent oxidoreductase n=1 Tax=Helicobacter sp. MIT 14-3879 TaxID=2040649 RepID=UPI000E1F60E1|nr:FAD-dependent oxidoreductase [Helicobacter sp. MIT 14-3879]RDU64201.1 malate:quinone oxidoreductase [Helicobacter sp. MIT 14-3879]
MDNNFDVAIIGGGISGCATFYTLSEYTDINKIVLLEKCDKLASISSSSKANSQTIHDGSIETNYTAQKAKKVKISADKLMHYALNKGLQNKAIFKMQKLAIGVGDEECEFITNRHKEFSEIFDGLKFFNKNEIKKIEPKIIESMNGDDRIENVVASGYNESWCGMNFEVLSDNFAKEAIKANPNNKIITNFKVTKIKQNADGSYMIQSNDNSIINAKFILVNAGSYSLPLAQKCGYGKDLGCLPVAGSFYFVPGSILRGKVYTVQNPKLPFAALHGDPDIALSGHTRLGPTAITMPKLERSEHLFGNLSSELLLIDFKLGALKVGLDLLKDSEIRSYVFRNIAFELPIIGKRIFIKDARKIIPSLKLQDLTYAKGFGEVRPQVIDMSSKKLELGEKKIITKKGLTFNMTPSPGATSCLGNAEIDTIEIVKYLNKSFDIDRFYSDLK